MALEIKTVIGSNLSFPSDANLSCFFLFLLIIDFLIPAVIAQIPVPTAELAIPTGITVNEANAEITTKPLTKTRSKNEKNKKFEIIQSPKEIFIVFTC